MTKDPSAPSHKGKSKRSQFARKLICFQSIDRRNGYDLEEMVLETDQARSISSLSFNFCRLIDCTAAVSGAGRAISSRRRASNPACFDWRAIKCDDAAPEEWADAMFFVSYVGWGDAPGGDSDQHTELHRDQIISLVNLQSVVQIRNDVSAFFQDEPRLSTRAKPLGNGRRKLHPLSQLLQSDDEAAIA